jgi:hypothetical protein
MLHLYEMPAGDGYIHFLSNCASLRDAGYMFKRGASQQHRPAEASKFTKTYMPEKTATSKKELTHNLRNARLQKKYYLCSAFLKFRVMGD